MVQSENCFDSGVDAQILAVHDEGLISPLFDRVDGGLRKGANTLGDSKLTDAAVLLNDGQKTNGALDVVAAGVFRIDRRGRASRADQQRQCLPV